MRVTRLPHHRGKVVAIAVASALTFTLTGCTVHIGASSSGLDHDESVALTTLATDLRAIYSSAGACATTAPTTQGKSDGRLVMSHAKIWLDALSAAPVPAASADAGNAHMCDPALPDQSSTFFSTLSGNIRDVLVWSAPSTTHTPSWLPTVESIRVAVAADAMLLLPEQYLVKVGLPYVLAPEVDIPPPNSYAPMIASEHSLDASTVEKLVIAEDRTGHVFEFLAARLTGADQTLAAAQGAQHRQNAETLLAANPQIPDTRQGAYTLPLTGASTPAAAKATAARTLMELAAQYNAIFAKNPADFPALAAQGTIIKQAYTWDDTLSALPFLTMSGATAVSTSAGV